MDGRVEGLLMSRQHRPLSGILLVGLYSGESGALSRDAQMPLPLHIPVPNARLASSMDRWN